MSEQELMDLTLKPEINIPKTLYRIKEKHSDKYELLVNAFTSLFPSIKNLYVEEITDGLSSRMRIERKNSIQSFSDKYYLLFVA